MGAISVGDFRIGGGQPLVLIAGPCVIESEAHALKLAQRLVKIAAAAGVNFIFKASYDKANRSSLASYRGPGLAAGLGVLRKIKERFGVPILTDIHEPAQAAAAAEVCDVLQVPAFLSRQTDLLIAAGKTGRVVNLKKGQFLAPWEMANAVEKVRSTGNRNVMLTERGASFRLQQPGGGHAVVSDPGADGMPGDFRCDACGATAGRARDRQRRPARIYRAAGAGRLRRGRGRDIHGSARPARAGAFRRSECAAARAAAEAAGEARATSGVGARVGRLVSIETARRVLRIEMAAIEGLLARLDGTFERAVEALLACKARVVVTGMGKSGLIGRKIAATFSSTGTPALFLHPAEALHGDLGMLAPGDVVVAISYGGETAEIVALLATIKRLALPLVTLTGNVRATLAAASDVVLDTSVREEACSLNLAPTASTAAAMAMGDALAIALLERRGFSHDDFAALHPGGRLGKKLLRVRDLMHAGDEMPRVAPEAKIPDVIYEISRKGLGMTTVVDGRGVLAGIITDGDLRRLMQRRGGATFDLAAGECLTREPATIGAEELASGALHLMEQRKITSVVVVEGAGSAVGVLHVHDLWTIELF